MSQCSIAGCERKVQARGICHPHYKRAVRAGNLPPRIERDPQESFWSRVRKADGCWEWAGSISMYGYGQFQPRRGKNYRAHKYAWELANGPVPEGLVLDHLCRNRACVNPGHLEPVTNQENTLRGIGPSAINAAAERCIRGHEFDSVGSKGERRCSICSNKRTNDWGRTKREAIICGAPTRGANPCGRRIAAGKTCRYHSTTNPGKKEQS